MMISGCVGVYSRVIDLIVSNANPLHRYAIDTEHTLITAYVVGR